MIETQSSRKRMMRAGSGLACVAIAVTLTLSVGDHGQAAAPSQQGAASPPGQLRWTFDSDPVGALPRGAVVFGGTWAVRAEAYAPSRPRALCQTGAATFPALVLGDAVFTNVVLSARFKVISGREDRAAGLIFRVQDKDDYYILRANALEDNVNIYVYAGGRRRALKEGSVTVPSGRWQTLRAEVTGPRIRGFLNNRLVVEAMDSAFGSGKIGLWTKADSVTCFDDVEARGTP
jgi:3-keto-disaccharide hydrolase